MPGTQAPTAPAVSRPLVLLRLTGRGILDAVGGLAGRKPLLVPLAGEPGTVAMLTTPDGRRGDLALNPGNRYPEWQQAIAARSAVRISFYRPGRAAIASWIQSAPFMTATPDLHVPDGGRWWAG
jgi:hypothetical protein